MNLHLGLYNNILKDPDDDLPRLVMADWLEERNNPGDAERSQFIKLQLEYAKFQEEEPIASYYYCKTSDSLSHYCSHCRWREKVHPILRKQELLLERYGHLWFDNFGLKKSELFYNYKIQGKVYHPRWIWRRGFIYGISCKLGDWWNKGRQIAKLFPLQRVELVDRIPRVIGDYLGWNWAADSEVYNRNPSLPCEIWHLLSKGEIVEFDNQQINYHLTDFNVYFPSHWKWYINPICFHAAVELSSQSLDELNSEWEEMPLIDLSNSCLKWAE